MGWREVWQLSLLQTELKQNSWPSAMTLQLRCMKLNSPNNTGAFVDHCAQCTHGSYEVTHHVLSQCDALYV